MVLLNSVEYVITKTLNCAGVCTKLAKLYSVCAPEVGKISVDTTLYPTF